jgi:hypothetical protein
VAERSMAADCKSAGRSLRWFKSIRPHHFVRGGSNSGVESQPSKLLVAGSNPVSRFFNIFISNSLRHGLSNLFRFCFNAPTETQDINSFPFVTL